MFLVEKEEEIFYLGKVPLGSNETNYGNFVCVLCKTTPFPKMGKYTLLLLEQII